MNTITPNIGQLRMLSSLRGQQWLARPDAIQAYALAALDVPEKANALNVTIEDYFELRPLAMIDPNGIAHIHVHSMLMNSCPAIYEKLGLVTCYSTLISEMAAAVNNGAKAILFHIDSPGGTVSGNIEASNYAANLPIPTASYCAGLACSAAYKFAAGTGAIIASESAQVGNIGTIMAWQDCSEFWASQGIEFKALTSEGADLKSTFHLEPNESQLAFLQESIDEAGATFREHVANGRANAGATIDPEVWRAGWYSGEHAMMLGLIDGIGTAEDAVNYLLGELQKVS